MTTIDLQQRTCAVCGAQSEYRIICSTNTFGAPDLDLRPAEMQRSTMPMWVQQCPACAYCAYDVSEETPDAADILESTIYEEIRSDDALPSLARSFLLLALLNESDHQVAANARLHAAWVCDDAELDSLASECRTKAIAAMAHRLPFSNSEEGISEGIVYVDMLRRTRQFQDAIRMIDELLSCSEAKDVIEQVLQYERDLCQQENTDCKTVADATAE